MRKYAITSVVHCMVSEGRLHMCNTDFKLKRLCPKVGLAQAVSVIAIVSFNEGAFVTTTTAFNIVRQMRVFVAVCFCLSLIAHRLTPLYRRRSAGYSAFCPSYRPNRKLLKLFSVRVATP